METVPNPDAKEPLKLAVNVDSGQVEHKLQDFVRTTVEDTLNQLLDAEADVLCGAKRYERSSERMDTRAGHYERKLQTQAGEVSLRVPKLRSLTFESDIIDRYRRREASVEEALVEMYLAGVSVRRVEDITQALWGTKVSSSTISELNQKIYVKIDEWREQPITERYPYIFADGIWLKRSWGGEVRNVAILVVIGVSADGYREILGVCEGGREDGEAWLNCLRWLKKRGLQAPKLATTDKCLGLVDALAQVFPETQWQRCTVHFKRNVIGAAPDHHQEAVARQVKAIYAQETRDAALAKAADVVASLREKRLTKAADCLEAGIAESLTYYRFPPRHWTRIRSNNVLERLNREIRRRTRVVGSFPDGRAALMLVSARLRHVAGTAWGTKRYLCMDGLETFLAEQEAA